MDTQLKYYTLFIQAILVAILLSPFIIKFAISSGIVDQPNGSRKKHQRATPYLGGLILYLSWLGTGYFSPATTSGADWIFASVGFIILLLTGIVDDAIDLNAKWKLVLQILAICCFVLPYENILDLQNYDLKQLFYLGVLFAIGILVINSFNLIDGLDGLSLGMGILWAAFLSYFSTQQGDQFLTLMLIVFIGASLGLSRINFHPAKIFLGDGGSLFIGGFIFWAFYRLFKNTPEEMFINPYMLIVVFSLPTIDVLAIIGYRLYKHQGIMKADRNHIHHLILSKTNSHPKTVGVLHLILFVNLLSCVLLSHFSISLYCFLIWIPIYLLIYVYLRFGTPLASYNK